jgi:hypothetical protein
MADHVLDADVASELSDSPGFTITAPHDHLSQGEETPTWRTNEC